MIVMLTHRLVLAPSNARVGWNLALLAGIALVALLAACAPTLTPARTPVVESAPVSKPADLTGTIAFVGANVLPMDREHVLERHTVVVRDGRIIEIAPDATARIPDDAQRIQAQGRYLLPGLTEMHGHVPDPNQAQYLDEVLFLYVSNGVTTVRNMSGHDGHIQLRERLARGDVLGPTLITASPWLGGDRAATPAAAESLVRRYQAAGFDLLKVGEMSREAYAQMVETAQALDLPFAGHVPQAVGLVGALDARQTSIDHFDRYAEFLAADAAAVRDPGFFGSGIIDHVDRARLDEAIKRTIAAGTWNVPTLSLVEHLASPEAPEAMARWPEMRYLPASVVEGWVKAKRDFQARADFQPAATRQLVALRHELLQRLHQAGAPIALGSDAPQFFNVPGFSIHHEMRMMVAAGLSPYQVLASGTREPARYFATPDAFGTIAPGRRADLLLLEANPLQDIANVQRRAGVMVAGRWLPEHEIQRRLAEIETRRRSAREID